MSEKNSVLSPAALPTIALIVATLLWSSSFIALKISFTAFAPFVVIFGRMVIASCCLIPLIIAKRSLFSFKGYIKGDWKLILFMAFCEPCLYFFFEAQAVVNTTASQAGIITAILPLLVMFAAAIFLQENISKRMLTGAGIAIAGVCWLTAGNTSTGNAPNPVLGNFLEFIAMVCATGYTIAMKKLTVRYSPLLLTGIQAVAGSFFFFFLLFLPSVTLPQSLAPKAALAVIYLGAVITLGAYGLYNYSLKYVPASYAGACINLIPASALLLGWLVLDETLTAAQLLATALILLGVYLSKEKSKKTSGSCS